MRISNGSTAFILIGIVGVFAAIPLLMKERMGGKNLTTGKEALTGTSVIRGAFSNYGSKDVGLDDRWEGGKFVGETKYNPTDAEVKAHLENVKQRKAAILSGLASNKE
jgi:hypothetical protein